MNQPDNRPVGVPGGGRRFDSPGPGAPGAVTPGPDGRNAVASGGAAPGADLSGQETERLLAGVEGDLASVEDKSTQEQVPVFDRIHTALADALARTADTGGSPAGGHQGA